jgi:hypothetical protein
MARIFYKKMFKNDDLLEADNNENLASVSSSIPFIGVGPIETYELEDDLHVCKNMKHREVKKFAMEMI